MVSRVQRLDPASAGRPLPEGVEGAFLRADSALYDHSLMVSHRRKVGFAISVAVSPGLMRRMQGLDEAAWHWEREDEGLRRHWAVLDYLPRRRDRLAAGRCAQTSLYRHLH